MSDTDILLTQEADNTVSCEQREKSADTEKEVENKSTDELSFLREEVKRLKDQLSERENLDRANSRMRAELAEFYECFPDAELDEIPDEIWQRVKKGASLSAEYSLFQRKAELSRKKAGERNEKNRKMSTGSLGSGDGERYYSPAEVKKMSPAQVKANYDDIIESMRHWN